MTRSGAAAEGASPAAPRRARVARALGLDGRGLVTWGLALAASLGLGLGAAAAPAPAPTPRPSASPASPGAERAEAETSPAPPPLPPGLNEARLAAVEHAISAGMLRLGIPGLTAALAHATAPDVVWSEGYGLSDVENDVPALPLTAYRLASLSKPITAIAVMQLAEQRRLDLDAPIQRYVPSFPEKPWPVTARRLLSHQGGVRHVADEEWGSTRHYRSVAAALDVFKDDPLLAQPGTRAIYSTYGYNLLGAAVEGVTGGSYLAYVRDAVLQPAGADGIRDDDPYDLVRHRAHGYRRERDELRNAILADTSNKVPGGGLLGTAGDMARVGAALLAHRLVQPATLRAMFEPQKLADGRPTEYTLGLRATTRRNRREIWHHGGQPRVSNLLYMVPARGLVIVLLCNLEGVAPGLLDLARELADLVLEVPVLRR